jgi:catechol 2,3-dioxygenase-like lactoylglutathione lyase family enzyme
MLLNYGQPLNGVTQFAFFVPDLEKAIARHVESWGIGPWFIIGPFCPPHHLYRGQRSGLTISLALAFSGGMMVELIQQHDDGPSPYRDTLGQGFGFHHIAVTTDRFDRELERYGALGYEQVFSDVLQGGRIAYVDTTRDLPGMTELIEYTPTAEARQTRVQRASQEWDGKDPIRRIVV